MEQTSYGVKESNPYNKLFEERIVFLGARIDDTSANDIIVQLIHLESAYPDRQIQMYINSPGGSFTVLTAIYDTMCYIRPDIATVCLGQASSAAAVLLAAGAPGQRQALPNARVLIHQPALEGTYGQMADLEIQAAEIARVRRQMEQALARHTGRAVDQIHADAERAPRSSPRTRPWTTASSTRCCRTGSCRWCGEPTVATMELATEPRGRRHCADRSTDRSTDHGTDRGTDRSLPCGLTVV